MVPNSRLCGISLARLEPHGATGGYLELQGATWSYRGPLGATGSYLELEGATWSCREPIGATGSHMERNLDQERTSCT
ncbi:unnamed protein product [Lampetra planeri]